MIYMHLNIKNFIAKLIKIILFQSFFQNEEFYVCIYAQRDCDTILFHHEGGVEIGDVDSKV